jgi:hypothetical protein
MAERRLTADDLRRKAEEIQTLLQEHSIVWGELHAAVAAEMDERERRAVKEYLRHQATEIRKVHQQANSLLVRIAVLLNQEGDRTDG